ncbi:MAG: hypothetical protein EXQ69_04210 [Acidimicrobiia bacterium]|nr:hypothetical protein [Acidimicrobiia bacterium]
MTKQAKCLSDSDFSVEQYKKTIAEVRGRAMQLVEEITPEKIREKLKSMPKRRAVRASSEAPTSGDVTKSQHVDPVESVRS